jgi:NAD+ kinase
MHYGITGNTTKEQLWPHVADLIGWMRAEGLSFCLHAPIVDGLVARNLASEAACTRHTNRALAETCDVVLSFGGDGTMLRSAYTTGANDTPLLGINVGKLGFLADIEVGHVTEAIRELEAGRYRIEPRLTLEAHLDGPEPVRAAIRAARDGAPSPGDDLDAYTDWALNEFVLDRSGASGLITIDVEVDGRPLNTYWADGLIFATPTGSTAYSLSTGGPLIAPGTDAIAVTPIAPHTLTVRPIVLPASATITARVATNGDAYVFGADGRTFVFEDPGLAVTIRRAEHTVNLVKLLDQDYFQTLRSKLMWGVRHPRIEAAAGGLGDAPRGPEAPNSQPAAFEAS